ncbi:MAG TPA: hypothetical protein VN154_01110 [Rhizomicrobium sp.]|nr:hypothetical protein [Rhizomicrobium sp.]
MRIDVTFIGLGLVILICGMVFGMWMGAKEDFQLADAHAHLNLLGFVLSAVYGLIYRVYPNLARSRLAWPQCIAHFLGVLIFVPGIAISLTMANPLGAIVGGTLVILATLAFGIIFITGDKLS